MHERIGPSRSDSRGVLKLGAAIDLIQDCSMLWMETEPEFHSFLQNNHLGMFLLSRQADILRLPVYGEQVSVTTSIYDCRSFFGYRNTALYGADGKPCILTWSVGAFVSIDTGKMVRLPTEIISGVRYNEKLAMDYLNKKIVVPPLPCQRLTPVTVRRCDIDFYNHMNNARYIDNALELVPDDKSIKRLRVEYKASAKRGDVLYPARIDMNDNGSIILLSNTQDSPYAVIELTYDTGTLS